MKARKYHQESKAVGIHNVIYVSIYIYNVYVKNTTLYNYIYIYIEKERERENERERESAKRSQGCR